jgi:hypothetical protein
MREKDHWGDPGTYGRIIFGSSRSRMWGYGLD